MIIRTDKDIQTLEAGGFDAAYPQRTPWDMIRASAVRAPGDIAIRYLNDASDPARDEIVTYANLAARCMAAARGFRALGVVPGKAVAILAQHTPQAQIALWGAQIAGHACPINPMLTPAHIAALLMAGNAAAVVITGVNDDIDYWSTLVPALRAEGVTLPFVDCDADAPCPGSDGSLAGLIATHSRSDDLVPEGDEHALAAYYHTGGTTGAPKMVSHSRLNEAHVARSCALLHDLVPRDVVVNGFPLFHVAGAFVYGLSTLCAGGTLIVPGRLGMRNQAFVRSIWQQVERHAITIIGAVPTVLAGMKSVPINADISSLKYFLTGGSPLPTELAEATEKLTGKAVRNILGMTECAGAIAVEPVAAPRTPLSCGLRMPFSELAILGETDGEADPTKRLGPDETGIIALRGPNVSAGYSDPARNADTFLPGGWLVSGDLGRMDTLGRLFVTGRKKDIIIRGAHNIDPQMIEDALLAHPRVETAAAVGMPDAYAGELPVAFVTLRADDGDMPDSAALIGFLKGRIEDPVALPKRIEVIETMPLTPVGKIFKPTLRQEATRWAILAVATTAGLATTDLQISPGDPAEVTVPQGWAKALREALAGMPVPITVHEGRAS